MSRNELIQNLKEELNLEVRYNSGLNQSERGERMGFEPKEVVWIIHHFFATRFREVLGYFAGMIYIGLTLVFYFLSTTFLANLLISPGFNNEFGFRMVIFCFTLGTSFFIIGSSLASHWKKEDVNLSSFIHNSITFILSGLLLFANIILIQFGQRYSSALATLSEFARIPVAVFGALTFTTSLWVMCKLLWRLQQLITTPEDEWRYSERLSPYSELKAFSNGVFAGMMTKSWWINLATLIIILIGATRIF
jgi:hypothetical protein